jgi:hypothetical protein
MADMPAYTKKLRASLSPAVAEVLKKLNTPHKIQDYLDTLSINFDPTGDLLSTKRVIEQQTTQCIEGALFAAASLAYHGEVPLLLDVQTIAEDEDHVVALFKQHGLWGAISKTNHGILRWRDPIYKTVREVAMSYFHEYYMHDGRKSMRAYSKPFDLRRYEPSFWVMSGESLEDIAYDLDVSPHFPAFPKFAKRTLRPVSKIEIQLLDHVEWQRPKNNVQNN